jgi:hypothetical protein
MWDRTGFGYVGFDMHQSGFVECGHDLTLLYRERSLPLLMIGKDCNREADG